jgi:uncharacterized protein (TIGR00369 family)
MESIAANPLLPVEGFDAWAQWIDWANGLPNFTEIGLECVEVGPGIVVATLASSRFSRNPNGAVNGGLVLSAADQCMGVVALTALPAGELAVTATVTAEFLRPAFPPLTLRGRVTQSGKNLVFVAVDVQGADGRLSVRCGGTMAVQPAERHRPST